MNYCMINYEKTTKIKKGKDTYTNNLEQKKITLNDETITQYCILAIDENKATILQGNTITTTTIKDNTDEEILKIFQTTTKKEPQKAKKTTKKTETKKETPKGGQ